MDSSPKTQAKVNQNSDKTQTNTRTRYRCECSYGFTKLAYIGKLTVCGKCYRSSGLVEIPVHYANQYTKHG